MARIYLDCCCVNRPFDDLSQLRVQREALAIAAILRGVEDGIDELAYSEALFAELQASPMPLARLASKRLMEVHGHLLLPTQATMARASELMRLGGMTPADAAHVAFSEISKVDCFLTVDDRLLRKCRRLGSNLRVLVENPLAWLLVNRGGRMP